MYNMNTFRKLIWTSSYTECLVLTSPGKRLQRYEKYKKMFENESYSTSRETDTFGDIEKSFSNQVRIFKLEPIFLNVSSRACHFQNILIQYLILYLPLILYFNV